MDGKTLCQMESGALPESGRSTFYDELPFIINRMYRCELLSRVLGMPKKNPIDFDEAIQMVMDKFCNSENGHGRGQNLWYLKNFVEWISELGYHIELTGEEFSVVGQTEEFS